MSIVSNLTKGFFKENPVLVIGLGLCPSMAVSTSIDNGVGMGLATTAVLAGSSALISMFRKFTPDSIRIPIFVVIIAAFVTLIDMIMKAYVPALSKSLGIFIPLIVVNCIILGRAEAYACKNSVFDSIIDAIGMGLGFTITLTILSAFREILGTGAIKGIPIFTMMGIDFKGSLMMILPPGGFLTMGLVLGFLQWNRIRKSKKAEAK